MTRYLLLIASALLLNTNSSFAQKNVRAQESSNLISGPMLSYIDNYHAQMWMLVSKETKEIIIKLENFDENRSQELVYDITDPKKLQQLCLVMTFTFQITTMVLKSLWY